jgi:dihydroorotate dehydrogenase electron transfer subunit
LRARVLELEACPYPYFRLRLLVSDAFADSRPGQFVMIEVGQRLEPFLRRAFSVHDVSKGPEGVAIDVLGKVVGRATTLMSECKVGDEVGVLGPLGRGFDLVPPAAREGSGRLALVAGGVGSAPLLILARQLAARGRSVDFFYGGRTAADLSRSQLFQEVCESSGGIYRCSTEDGSAGLTGFVTVALEEALAVGDHDFIYSCGPMALLAVLATMSARLGVPGEAAIETPMGCGFGACLGCAVPHVEGRWALCCKDGPVFGFDEVRW